MAAATAARNLKIYGEKRLYPEELTVKTGETIYQGALCRLDSNDELIDGVEAVGEGPVFVANETVTSAAAGAKIKVWHEGIVGLENGSSIDVGDIGKPAYLDDNQTVKLNGAGTGLVGRIHWVRASDGLVYVDLNKGDSRRGQADGYRHLADDAALTILDTDSVIEVTGVAGNTIAATMTVTYAGHEIEVRAVAADATHKYTLGASQNGSAGDVTLNAANEYVKLICDGTTWHVVLLSGATFA